MSLLSERRSYPTVDESLQKKLGQHVSKASESRLSSELSWVACILRAEAIYLQGKQWKEVRSGRETEWERERERRERCTCPALALICKRCGPKFAEESQRSLNVRPAGPPAPIIRRRNRGPSAPKLALGVVNVCGIRRADGRGSEGMPRGVLRRIGYDFEPQDVEQTPPARTLDLDKNEGCDVLEESLLTLAFAVGRTERVDSFKLPHNGRLSCFFLKRRDRERDAYFVFSYGTPSSIPGHCFIALYNALRFFFFSLAFFNYKHRTKTELLLFIIHF